MLGHMLFCDAACIISVQDDSEMRKMIEHTWLMQVPMMQGADVTLLDASCYP